MALCRQVIDFVRLHLLYDADKRAAVRHVPVVEVYETVLLHVTHPFIQIKMLYASGVER